MAINSIKNSPCEVVKARPYPKLLTGIGGGGDGYVYYAFSCDQAVLVYRPTGHIIASDFYTSRSNNFDNRSLYKEYEGSVTLSNKD